MRLDSYLVQKDFFETRTKAQTAIKEGLVLINKKTEKASYKVLGDEQIEILAHEFFVSRAAKKLDGFFQEFPLDIKTLSCLDVGASTGGFTQMLLKYGAKSVMALDVGSKQLHHSLLSDKRVTSVENQDVRSFVPAKPFELVSCDVSFISILNIIDALNSLSSRYIIILFKPQFEVGKQVKRDSHGVVLDNKAIKESINTFEAYTQKLNWELLCQQESKVLGKEGNREYLYCFRKN